MKISYIITLICLMISVCGYCQIEKVETFIPGTKITYYTNACGTTIPEADNKLTFCDEANNLGVVEASFGLNADAVEKTIPNYYNNDEVYLTDEGFSIHKEDGSWFNIPKFAIPTSNLSFTISSEDAIITPDGKLLFGDSNGATSNLIYFDFNTLEFDFFNISNDYDARKFVHDSSSNITYVIAKSFSDMRLFSVDGDNFTDEGAISNLPTSDFSWNYVSLSDGFIYAGGNDTLYKIEISNANNVSIYNQNSLPYAGITGIDTDESDNVWISFNDFFVNDGAIAKLDTDTDIFETYTLSHSSGTNYRFKGIAVSPDGKIWTSSETFTEEIIVSFSPDDGDVWEIFPTQDFTNLGIPIDNIPNSIHSFNQTTYFTFGQPSDYKILKNNDGIWSGVTDRTPGNISINDVESFGVPHELVPAKDGGIWSYNKDKATLFKLEGNDIKTTNTFTIQSNLTGDERFIIDVDGKPTSVFGATSRIIKLNEPIVEEGSPLGYSPRSITSFEDKLWIRDQFSTLHVILEDNEIVNYNLTNYENSQITADSSGNIIYSKIDADNNEFVMYQYDVVNDVENTFNYTYDPNAQFPINSDIIQISLSNNKMVFLYEETMFLFNNGTISEIPFDSLGFDSSATVRSAVADELGNLIMMIDNNLVRILDPFGSINVESYQISGSSNNLFPETSFYPFEIALDTEGTIWFQGFDSWTKVYLANANPSSPFFENSRIKGTVYYDKNNNDAFDAGEEAVNQRMAINKDGEQSVRYSFTDENGNFQFLYQGTGDYTVSTLASDPYKISDSPFLNLNVSDLDTDTDLGLIQLEINTIESLLVKSSEKLGAYGFDRAGFTNTFTTAIGNISNTKTFTNLDLQFLYQVEDEFSGAVLPQINEVIISEVLSNNDTPVIFNTRIEPTGHRWSISGNISDYTVNTLTITPTITENDDKVTVDFNISQLDPNSMIVVEVKTDLFPPEENGTAIEYGLSSISGDNIGEFDDPATVTLIPRQQDDSILGFPENLPPEIDPLNPVPPANPDKPIFAPDRNRTRILSSYDPNDKLVSPGLPDVLNEVDINTPFLTYTIRFENEGNFSAKDIYILDELDDNIDFNSIQLIEASHDVVVDQLEIEGKTNLRFFFENIFLDYTANDPIASQGYVKFAVSPIDNIQENTIIENTAAIYFDQNPPIITNTTQNKFVIINLSNQDFLNGEINVKAYPNPVLDYLKLNLPNQGDYNVEIFDLMGKQVYSNQFKNTSNISLSFNAYDRGIYILKLTYNNKSIPIKIIKN